MALTQIVELHTETGTVVLTSEAHTVQALQHENQLHQHRNNRGLGTFSIGHFNRNNDFVVPNNN
tara:strand:- start:262 stop:453 length:192 start_codon:yes stop_codon:yes gene_type:complete